jgi:hypothetical protein
MVPPESAFQWMDMSVRFENIKFLGISVPPLVTEVINRVDDNLPVRLGRLLQSCTYLVWIRPTLGSIEPSRSSRLNRWLGSYTIFTLLRQSNLPSISHNKVCIIIIIVSQVDNIRLSELQIPTLLKANLQVTNYLHKERL